MSGYNFESWEQSEAEREKLLKAMDEQAAVARAAQENTLILKPGMPPREQVFQMAMMNQQKIMNSLTLLALWQTREIYLRMVAMTSPAKAVLQ